MSQMAEYTSLLSSPHSVSTIESFPLDPCRFYVLFLFAFLGTQQCYVWYSFGSIPTQTTAYYALTKDEGDAFVDLTMTYGPIVLLVVIVPCMWVLTGAKGLQLIMRLSAILTFSCCLLRCLPSILFPNDASQRQTLLWLCHIGQILNAAAGGTYLSAGSRVSAVWFPSAQRTLATAVALMGGNLGMMIGYGLGALFSSSVEGVPQLLYVELALSMILLILTTFFCPVQPRTTTWNIAPLKVLGSDTSAILPSSRVYEEGFVSARTFFRDVARILSLPSLWFLLLAGGLESGVNSAWGGLLPQIFETRFDSDSADALANECGLLNCSGSLLGMLVSGWIADTFFQRRLKQLMLIYFILGVILTIGVTLMFPTPFASTAIWQASEWQVALFMTVAGGFQGCLDPLFLELAAEITFPSKEGTSAGLSNVATNFAALAVLLLAPVLFAVSMNTVYLVGLITCVLLTSCVRQQYLRSDFVCWTK